MNETPEQRSRTMRAVRSRNTQPELLVRRIVHSAGYRYRLHRPDLAGTPDLVFPSRRAVIFVNGCFWHGHDCKRGARPPATNKGYWHGKISRNQARDSANLNALQAENWRVLTIWECETKDVEQLADRLRRFIGETAT